MNIKQIDLDQVAIDASTQTRVSIDESVVADYAERMLDGVTFPPVVLFYDGERHFIGDGFHRVRAALHNGAVAVFADVRLGTVQDALWFALGANREHGRQMSHADRRHAITIALRTWGDTKTASAIAEQLGVSHQRISEVRLAIAIEHPRSSDAGTLMITRKNGRPYPATLPSTTAAAERQRVEIAALVKRGDRAVDIMAKLGVRGSAVAAVRRELGVSGRDNTRAAVTERLDTMRQMAADGYTSRQIAAAVAMTVEGCRAKMRAAAIAVTADKVAGHSHQHDANRIVEHMVMDAENLTADVRLIDFAQLDAAQLSAWVLSLKQSRDALNQFITRLTKEQHTYEATQTRRREDDRPTIEGADGADQ